MKTEKTTREPVVHGPTALRSQNAEQKKSITGSLSVVMAVEEAFRYAESIVEAVREPLLVLDANLKIISANRSFYRTFQVTPGETIGSFIYGLGNRQWDIPKLREMLEEVLPEKEAFDDFEVDHNFQDIGHKIMLLNARQIYRKDIGAKMILLAIEDITERRRLERELKDSEKRFRRLFETASDGIVLLEKREGKIAHANSAIEKMLGYSSKESIGNRLQGIGISLDNDDFKKTIQELNTHGIIHYDDVPVKTKLGQYIDTDIYLVDKAELVQCNIRDITERKKTAESVKASLREKEMMLKEIYHRVKNNMQVISSLLDMQSSFLQDEQAKAALQNSVDRIEVMADIHNLLYHSDDMAKIDISDFVKDLTSSLQQSYNIAVVPIEIRIDTTDAWLTIEQAVPCGLIMNELISNAMKHAFPGERKGRQGKINISMP